MKKTKMKNDNTDPLRDLLNGGILAVSPDFTSRVMDKVVAERAPVQRAYRPLISIKGWIIIISSVLILVASCLMILLNGNYASSGYLDFLDPVVSYINDINLAIDIGALFIGLMVSASIAILLLADFVFSTNINPETGFE